MKETNNSKGDNMPANVMDDDKVVVVGGIPQWHKMGKYYTTPMTAEEAHADMGGSFTLYQRPVGIQFEDGEFSPIDKQFAIVRGPTNKDSRKIPFGFTSDHYKPIQPIDLIKKFDEKVGVSISTLLFIQDGRKMALSWELPSFEVKVGDEIKLYAALMMGFDKVFSSRINVGTHRPLCENTWMANMAEAEEENKKNRGRGTIYSGKHSNPRLLFELGEWMEFIQQNSEREQNLIKSFFAKMVEKTIVHERQAMDLLTVAWPDPAPFNPNSVPVALRQKESDEVDKEAEKAKKTRNGIYDLFTGSEGIGIDANYYGLFNACTQYFNHKLLSKKDTAYSISWGNRSNEMNHFAEVLRYDLSK